MGYFPIRNSTYTQVVPSATWVIKHNATGVPIVDVYCEVDNVIQKIIPLSVDVISPGTCQITFSVARTGTAVVSG